MRHAFLRSLALPLGALAVALTSSCGSDPVTTGGTGTGGGTPDTKCPDGLIKAPGSEFCDASAKAVDCTLVTAADHNQVCGVPLRDPSDEPQALRDGERVRRRRRPPARVLHRGRLPPKPAASSLVQMSGTVKIFAHGCESKLVKIEVFEVGADGALGTPAGTALTTAMDCKLNGVASDNKDCGTPRYECNYIYGNVPTEKELVVRTSGLNWAELYDYNVYIPASEVVNGEWKHNLRALASDDYNSIAQSAIGGPITSGNGALAGEVHDCGDVRLQNAIVGIDQPKKIITYFTSNEANLIPDTNATGTSILGLYAALDVAPGPVTVAALGNVSGKVTTLGYYHARIFPNAVSIVTFRGTEPFQIP